MVKKVHVMASSEYGDEVNLDVEMEHLDTFLKICMYNGYENIKIEKSV